MTGRPPIYGEPLVERALGLPATAWAALDAEARARGMSTSALIRERIGLQIGAPCDDAGARRALPPP